MNRADHGKKPDNVKIMLAGVMERSRDIAVRMKTYSNLLSPIIDAPMSPTPESNSL